MTVVRWHPHQKMGACLTQSPRAFLKDGYWSPRPVLTAATRRPLSCTFRNQQKLTVDLVAIEVIQSVQDWNNSVPLVEDKKTVVRAHFQSASPGNLRPTLRAFRGGVALPGGSRMVDNKGHRVPLTRDATTVRGSWNRVARFRLPPEWTNGTITLEVDAGEDTVRCQEAAPPVPGDCQVEVSFEVVARPSVIFYDLAWREGRELHEVTGSETENLVGRLKAAYPVSDVKWSYRARRWPAKFGRPPDKAKFSDLIAILKAVRKLDDCGTTTACVDLYYGTIAKDAVAGKAGAIPSSVAVGFVPSDPRALGRHAHSHEIGHMLGLSHSVDREMGLDAWGRKQGPCGSVANPPAPDFPFIFEVGGQRRPTLGPMDAGDQSLIYGYDSDLGVIVNPNKDFDMMSYCQFAPVHFWPSSHTYVTLKENIDLQFGNLEAALQNGVPADYMLFRGIVDLEDFSARLLSSALLEDVMQPDNPPAGDFTLRLLDSSGSTIQEISFSIEAHEVLGEPGSEGDFAIAVPIDGSIAKFEIVHNSQVIASIEASANTPEVLIISPAGGETLASEIVELHWESSDADGDELSHSVQYSADDGLTWITLAADLEQRNLVIARDQLAASENAKWRVQASDGFNVGFAVSGAFNVMNNAPSVFIDTPNHGELFVGGQTIFFEATAIDPEDGLLNGDDFTWSSDLDGDLGFGNPLLIPVDSVQDGEHLITVTAMDSQSLMDDGQVTIMVSQIAPTELADLALEWTGGGIIPTPGFVNLQARVINYGPEDAVNVSVNFSLLPRRSKCVGEFLTLTCPS